MRQNYLGGKSLKKARIREEDLKELEKYYLKLRSKTSFNGGFFLFGKQFEIK